MNTALRIDYFEEAKASHALDEFFENQLGARLRKTGKSIRTNVCPEPTCGESSNKDSQKVKITEQHFRCYRCGTHGSVVDAAALIWGKEPKEAAKELAGGRYRVLDEETLRRRNAEREERKRVAAIEEAKRAQAMQDVLRRILALSQQFAKESGPLQYLTGLGEGERAISEKVLVEAQRRRLLGFLPADPQECLWYLEHAVGKDLLVATGFWNPEKKMPGIAFKPIVFFYPGAYLAEFRMIGSPTDGHPKSLGYGTPYYPWFWQGRNSSSALLNEGVIDSLSAVDMGYDGHILGLPGVRNWRLEWMLKFARAHGIRQFDIAFDDDVDQESNWGQNVAKDMIEELGLHGLVARNACPIGGDLNDVLRRKKGAK